MARDTQGNNMTKPKLSIASMHKSMAPSNAPPKAKGGDSMGAPSTSAGEPGAGEHSELHDHGDGTFHTVKGGQQEEHPHLHHALASMAAHHGAGDKHMMVHHDGMNLTTHHAGEDGQVQGPHEHDPMNLEGLKSHMDQFLSEEGGEPKDMGGAMGEHEPAMAHHGGGPVY